MPATYLRCAGTCAEADRKRMVLSTIHVSQAHIFEKQSRCRESGSSVSTVVPVPGFFFSVYSPETVIFGGWDSTRSKNQLRIPSVMVGETYAILAEQEEDPVIHRAGGRIDPVGASVIVSTEADRQKIVGDSIDLSDKTKTSFKKSGKGSTIGLGAIPPSAKKDVLDGVSVRKVISTRVLSFATVRTFHFGKGVEGDAAIRALILAVLLRDIAGYDENPFIRANCFLAETGKPTVMLNKRYGEKEELEPLTAGMAEKLLEEAYAQAHEKAGITWEGQEFLVEGNPAVLANASAEDDEKGN